MNKNIVKIIKRYKKTVAEDILSASQLRPPPAKAQITNQREMIRMVNSWIDERGANRQTEEIAASSNLLAWKIIPEDSKENKDD